MKIPIGSDHAGFELKERIKTMLIERGHEVVDLGTFSTDAVDYPDYAANVARSIQDGTYERGILLCGSGEGVCITANRFNRVRAALIWNTEVAVTSRTHNDANILCYPAKYVNVETAERILDIFLTTPFEGGRHERRVQKMTQLPNDLS
jgi:ribose 5-phosphate isomerase B